MRLVFAIIVLLLVPHDALASECTAVITSDNRADYAAASALALKNDFVLVTTPWGRLSEDSVQGLAATGCTKAYVVGGKTAVPGAEEALAGHGIIVERLGGVDRYETSAAVASVWKNSLIIFIASGHDTKGISDATSAAGAAGAPVVFVKDDDLPQAVGDAIEGLRARDARTVPSPAMDTASITAGLKGAGIKENHITKIDKRERTENAIMEANTAISDAGQMLGDLTRPNAGPAHVLIEAAKRHLDAAYFEFENGNYVHAFGQATSAREDAENSRKLSSGIVAGYLREVAAGRPEGPTLQATAISEISANPLGYHGTTIKVTGEVLSDPVYIDGKTYIELQDQTGVIIVEREGFAGPPVINKGDRVLVSGTIKISPSYGGPHGGMDENMPAYMLKAEDIESV